MPWTPDVQVVYEHLHRYLWAARLVEGKRVLDLGSGEGFGSSILADMAHEVVGLDVDELTVEHARLSWSGPSVSFMQGSALDLSVFEACSFDAVVAFELIEHLDEQERVLAEIARVLSTDGLLIISTPDRRIYSDASGQRNPFHRRELTAEEFSALLEGTFSNVALAGQRTITGSHLGALDRPAVPGASAQGDFFVERAGEEWRIAGQPAALYLIAVASNATLPEIGPASTLGDCGLELVRAKEREAGRVANALIGERDVARERQREALDALRRREVELEEHALARRAELERRDAERNAMLVARDAALLERDEFLGHRQDEILALRSRLSEMDADLERVRRQSEEAQRLARQVEASVTWQVFQRVRANVISRLGERALAVRTLRLGLRLGGRMINRRGAISTESPAPMSRGEPIKLPCFEHPTASLVIPLHSDAALTRRCLESIRDNTDRVSFEVILVDDEADQATKGLVEELVSGARVLRNEENLGYLRSVNLGAAAARGEWLVLCNNDIEVTANWLSAMLACAQSPSRVGVVAPKYISPDGKLSEAGGIIWRDGTGVNYGRGEEPSDFRYEYTREIDYGSAAALLVRGELWRELGGYDERFLPMYYEDVDVCMQARQRGWQVLYEPSAVVVHIEGGTAGTDPSAGHKRHQEINRVKLVEKWHDLLEAEHMPPSPCRVREAANRHRGPHVLVVDFRTPMWDRDAGSLRMFEIIRSLLRLGYSVTFVPDNFAVFEPYTRTLERLGVEVASGALELTSLLKEIGPTLTAAILSRPHPASRWLDSVRELAPGALVIYDTVDLHWVRESRRFALNSPEPSQASAAIVAQGPKATALFELELAMVRASDLTIAVTEEERTQIVKDVPSARVVVIPTVHEVAEHVNPPNGRSGVLFVGGFEHPPNVDAVNLLVREVMPHVWMRNRDVSLTIVGGSAPPEVEVLAAPRVEVRGWVRDLGPLLGSSRALVAPVRFGAGVKGKITQGLAAGLPVVTTTLGAEGLNGRDGETMLIGDDPEALAERIVRIIDDDELWCSLSSNGLELIAESCSLEVLDQRLCEALATVPSAS